MEKFNLKNFLEEYGILYSKELGIDLETKNKDELFKWFLASLLFGARITETIAKNTYKTLEKYDLLTPQKILKTGRSFLINPVMREGGYVRYDGKTSDELLKVSDQVLERYKGDLNLLHKKAKNSKDLEEKLQQFFSVGPVTCRIFLRELRGIWKKADPKIGRFVESGAKRLGLPSDLEGLKEYWRKNKVFGFDFRHLEVALLRYGKRP